MSGDKHNKRVLDSILKGEVYRPVKRQKPYAGITESQIQQSCVNWFKLQYGHLWDDGVFWHTPNERKCSDALGARLKREGVVRGVADMTLAVSRHGFNHLYIECKRPGCYQSPAQKHWEQGITKHGSKYVVVKSLDEFMCIVNWYLNE